MRVYRQMAAAYRAELGKSSGVVVFWCGAVQGWVDRLRDPDHWRPGCIAVDTDGRCWRAVGGNEIEGAERWEEIA